MANLSQNKKIAISVVLVFIISFAAMVLFLDGESHKKGGHMQANIFELSNFGDDHKEESYIDQIQNSYLNVSPVPMMLVNGASRVEYMNQSFCELMTAGCEKLKGRLVFDLVNVRDLPNIFSITNQLYRDGKKVEGAGPYRLRNGDEEIVVMMNGRSILDEEGKVTHMLLSFRDITSMIKELSEPEFKAKPFEDGGEDKPIKVLPQDDIERLMARE